MTEILDRYGRIIRMTPHDRAMLTQHLDVNHYPSAAAFKDAATRAIDAVNHGMSDIPILTPLGTMAAWRLIEWLRLEPWVASDPAGEGPDDAITSRKYTSATPGIEAR